MIVVECLQHSDSVNPAVSTSDQHRLRRICWDSTHVVAMNVDINGGPQTAPNVFKGGSVGAGADMSAALRDLQALVRVVDSQAPSPGCCSVGLRRQAQRFLHHIGVAHR